MRWDYLLERGQELGHCLLAAADEDPELLHVYATLDEENSVDYLSEDIEASKGFVDVYFSCGDDQLQKVHLNIQVCHFRKLLP